VNIRIINFFKMLIFWSAHIWYRNSNTMVFM